MLHVPTATAVTTPVEISTVATEVLSELHSPFAVPSEDKEDVSPNPTVVVPEMVPASGLLIVTRALSEPVHP